MKIQTSIEKKLSEAVKLTHLTVENESHMHNVPANSETHFKVVLVSASFEGKRSVARHQVIYKILAEELEGPVHALAIYTYTPKEWSQQNESVPNSPDCKG